MAVRLMRNEGTLRVFRLLAVDLAKMKQENSLPSVVPLTESSSLEVDVAESLFAELQSS